MPLMKKTFATVMVAALAGVAGLGWYMLQPVVNTDGFRLAETGTIEAGRSDSGSQPVQVVAQTTAQLSPYERCPETGAHPGDIQRDLTEQLLPLLANGKTPAELLRYDLTGAIWHIAYAESVAQAMQIIGAQRLNILEPSVLDMLADRVKQELSNSPEEFARVLAADEDFQVFVPTGMGTWNGSVYLSPSLLFLQLSEKIPAAEFKRLIAGKTFTPLEIAVAMQSQLPTEYLLQLVAQGRDLDQFPAGYHNYQSRTPAWNLADIAAMHWQPAVLQALKQQGVVPSNIEGVVTGLDFALFSEPARQLESDKNTELQRRLKQAQRETVAYLLAEGYWAHGYQMDNDKWYFGNNFLNTNRFENAEILALLPAGAPEHVFRRAELTPQPVPAGTALANWLTSQQQAKAQAQQARQQCLSGKQQLISTEALLSREAIEEQIFAWRDGKPAAELALAPLHQRDPAWLAWHWQMGGAPQQDADARLRDQLTDLLHDPVELMAFLQKTELDSGTTAWLLMEVMTKPELVPAFEQRFAPKAPAYLYPGYGFKPEQDLKVLLEAGFDLGIEDLYGRNFFHWAFQTSPETVLLLLNEGLSAFAQAMGPDALDLALEHSYLQRYLHPALPLILSQLTDPEPSHLARLKRLQLYRPDLYQSVLKLKPDLQLPPETMPNELLSPPQL
jgi:hypothetical protein